MGEHADDIIDRIIDGGMWGYPIHRRKLTPEQEKERRDHRLRETLTRLGDKMADHVNKIQETN